MSEAGAKGLSQIFAEASKIRKKQERIDFFQSWDRPPTGPLIRTIIRAAYHPRIHWLLPRGIPPFKRNPTAFDAHGVLYREYHKFDYFIYGARPEQERITPQRREDMFVKMLEMVHPDDALLLCAIKDKHINYPYLTYTNMYNAFPDVIPARDQSSWLEESDRVEAEKEEVFVNEG